MERCRNTQERGGGFWFPEGERCPSLSALLGAHLRWVVVAGQEWTVKARLEMKGERQGKEGHRGKLFVGCRGPGVPCNLAHARPRFGKITFCAQNGGKVELPRESTWWKEEGGSSPTLSGGCMSAAGCPAHPHAHPHMGRVGCSCKGHPQKSCEGVEWDQKPRVRSGTIGKNGPRKAEKMQGA
jgi:hypothetical protein